ncbi:Adenylate cyclase type 1 [Borealophlyctis nickersoniae]|nr:Adenylate cyclase type 1 [Borealophlyctis nickersoniae]
MDRPGKKGDTISSTSASRDTENEQREVKESGKGMGNGGGGPEGGQTSSEASGATKSETDSGNTRPKLRARLASDGASLLNTLLGRKGRDAATSERSTVPTPSNSNPDVVEFLPISTTPPSATTPLAPSLPGWLSRRKRAATTSQASASSRLYNESLSQVSPTGSTDVLPTIIRSPSPGSSTEDLNDASHRAAAIIMQLDSYRYGSNPHLKRRATSESIMGLAEKTSALSVQQKFGRRSSRQLINRDLESGDPIEAAEQKSIDLAWNKGQEFGTAMAPRDLAEALVETPDESDIREFLQPEETPTTALPTLDAESSSTSYLDRDFVQAAVRDLCSRSGALPEVSEEGSARNSQWTAPRVSTLSLKSQSEFSGRESQISARRRPVSMVVGRTVDVERFQQIGEGSASTAASDNMLGRISHLSGKRSVNSSGNRDRTPAGGEKIPPGDVNAQSASSLPLGSAAGRSQDVSLDLESQTGSAGPVEASRKGSAAKRSGQRYNRSRTSLAYSTNQSLGGEEAPVAAGGEGIGLGADSERMAAGETLKRVATDKRGVITSKPAGGIARGRKSRLRTIMTDSHYHFEKPPIQETVKTPVPTFWESFMHPLEESPSTGWTMLFPPSMEDLFQTYLYYLLIAQKERTVLWALVFAWTAITIATFLAKDGKIAKAIQFGNFATGCVILVVTLCSYLPNWRPFWRKGIGVVTFVLGASCLNNSYHVASGGFFAPVGNGFPLGTVSMNLLVNIIIISAVSPLHFLMVIPSTFVIVVGQICIDASILFHHSDIPGQQIVANAMMYFLVFFVGGYFRYMSELHIRRAFVKYCIVYKNRRRLYAAREQSEYLLSMILPAKIIDALRRFNVKGPEKFRTTTHDTFTELRGVTIDESLVVLLFLERRFTEFSAAVSADRLVSILSELFSGFDAIATELNLEKIKTIGDCIQIAGGVPEQVETEEEVSDNACRVCAMSIRMLSSLGAVNAKIGRNLKLRIGVHTGSVIGGVTGLWKFKYDIWSEDVDIASIMEQTGRPNIPHVTADTHALICHKFTTEPAGDVTTSSNVIKTFDIVVSNGSSPTPPTLTISTPSPPKPFLPPKSTADAHPPLGLSQSHLCININGDGPDAIMAGPAPGTKKSEPMDPWLKGRSQVRAQRKKISDTHKKFQKEIRTWTRTFRDPNKEADYRDDYMRSWPGTLTVASCVVCIGYFTLLGAHAIAAAPSFAAGTFAIEIGIGLVLIVLIIFTYRLNRNYRERVIAIVDKGDRPKSALWVASSDSFPPGGAANRDGSGKKRADAHQDWWAWYRPNTFAICTLIIAFVGTAVQHINLVPSRFSYYAASHACVVQLHMMYHGTKIVLMNSCLFIFGTLFLWDQIGTGLYWLFQDPSPLPFTIVHIYATAVALYAVIIVVALWTNFAVDEVSRLNFYMKREDEAGYSELKGTQAAAERLLLNILPLSVVQRLKDNPKLNIADARPETSLRGWLNLFFPPVFSTPVLSFAGNTGHSLIDTIITLNDLICDIDALAESRNVEKIKTIGTKYMAMAEPTSDVSDYHLSRICDFSLDLMELMKEFNVRTGESFSLKMGIHVGPAVSGLIGTKTFTFDVWGDTVNVASRMESTGRDNSIQVTADVQKRLKATYAFESRGKVYVKGKGDMETYFLLASLEDENELYREDFPGGEGNVRWDEKWPERFQSMQLDMGAVADDGQRKQ